MHSKALSCASQLLVRAGKGSVRSLSAFLRLFLNEVDEENLSRFCFSFCFSRKKGERERLILKPASCASEWGTPDWSHGLLFISLILHYLWKWTFCEALLLTLLIPLSRGGCCCAREGMAWSKWLQCKAICFAQVPSEQHCHFNNSRSRDCFPRFQSSLLIRGRIRGTLKTVSLGGLQIIKMKVSAQWLLLGKRVIFEGSCLVRKKGSFQSAV